MTRTTGWKTVAQGSKALIIDRYGQSRIVDGPQRLFLWRAKQFDTLVRYAANQSEYLWIQHADGTVEHRPGPCVVFHNPLLIRDICVRKAIVLDGNEVLVVYRKSQETGKMERRLQQGPTQFVPSADEWMHEFSWHGPDKTNKTKLIPNQWRFTKLKVVPDQFYYNVRTVDDALVKVKMMLFYEIKDIELMLQETKDPIADMANAVTADVIAFASQLTYEDFLEQTGKLNELGSFPQLVKRTKAIGYHISKAVYRGYQAPAQLQRMHDDANERRTKLKLSVEQVEQDQEMTDLKLESELDTLKMQHKLKMEQEEHKHKLNLEELEHKIAMEDREHENHMQQMILERQSELEMKQNTNNQMVDYLRQLKSLGVDLTEYLKSKNPRPDKVTRVVTDTDKADIHLHSSSAV
ncbi:uncharacterized protein LOC134196423 [Corticium candelabrum]|uniref:uncharacterized protein LOC134196423 n=1 Tax=Corticium candelabrum TaxID=121492 RepID=UPI002E26A63E|nr:uncharacterized protein LOC134196423 [Corticium candelabrum]